MRIEFDSRIDLAVVVQIFLTVALFIACVFEQLVTLGENCKISVLRIRDFLISLRDFRSFEFGCFAFLCYPLLY